MKDFVLISGSILGVLAVVLGAFAAHALKSKFTEDQQKNFETGVRYQMYHALLLLFIGTTLDFQQTLATVASWCILIGCLLFSFSIYGLCLSSAKGNKWRFLGPVTPLGGLLLVAGWLLLLISFLGN